MGLARSRKLITTGYHDLSADENVEQSNRQFDLNESNTWMRLYVGNIGTKHLSVVPRITARTYYNSSSSVVAISDVASMEQTEEVASIMWDEYFATRDDENAEWLNSNLSSYPQVVSSLMATTLKIRGLWKITQVPRFQLTRLSDPETPEYLVVFVPGGNEDEDIERLWRVASVEG